MRYTLNDTTIDITMSANELHTMEARELAVYGTPDADAPGEPISNVYVDQSAVWRYDRCLAFAEDFDRYPAGEKGLREYTITIPRTL